MPYIAKMNLKQQLLLVLKTGTAVEALEDAIDDDKAANDLHNSEMEAFEDKNDLSDNDDKNEFTLQNRYLNWDK